jgi:polyphosphate kinase
MLKVKYLPTLPSLLASTKLPIIHRDLSWIQFNDRVLDEARSSQNPLLERVKFLAISASNLDEFFMIRASSIERSLSSRNKKAKWGSNRNLLKVRASILEAVGNFVARQSETLEMFSTSLEEFGVKIVRNADPDSIEFETGRKLFEEQICPKLDPPESFSFAKLNQLENLQTAAIFPGELWLRIPRALPAMLWTQVEGDPKRFLFYFLDDLLAAHLWPRSTSRWKPGFLRLTRDGDFTLDFEDQDPESIPDVVMTRVGTRERGRPIRMQYIGDITPAFLDRCRSALKLSEEQIFPASSTMYLNGLWTIVNHLPEDFGPSELRYPSLQSRVPTALKEGGDRVFSKISERDYLLHHPYDSFDAYVEFIRAACNDPHVRSIQQTVYRMDALSPVIGLLKAAAREKNVGVVIELRARFDELNNLHLADELEKAGVKVAFGFGALKVHAKVALVSRLEASGEMRLYTHLSTGNYNSKTARQYTDLAILTANTEIGRDAQHFFDSLYLGEIPQSFKQLVVAPTKLARRLQMFILEEAKAAREGKRARIVAKVNALVDEGIIESLYMASQAGVQVDLIVRGACSLIPGIKRLSENIRVVSIVDRFLEHSRIYYFESSKKMYLSSADWMPRNFFSRLEIAFPILDPRIYTYLEHIVIPAYLSDTVKARQLTHQGTWKRLGQKTQGSNFRAQVLFRELALYDYKGTPLA